MAVVRMRSANQIMPFAFTHIYKKKILLHTSNLRKKEPVVINLCQFSDDYDLMKMKSDK